MFIPISMFFDRLADTILKYPKQIILVWAVVILCALPLAIQSGDVLKYDMQEVAVAESESVIGLSIIEDNFYSPEISVSDSPMLVLKTDESAGVAGGEFLKFVDMLEDRLPEYTFDGGQKVLGLSYSPLPSQDEDSSQFLAAVTVIYNPAFKGIVGDTADLRNFISGVLSEYKDEGGAIGITTYVTGTNAINHDMEAGVISDLSKIEPVTILLILILIGLFFRSLISAATPPMAIGIAYGVTLALVFIMGSFIDIFFITNMMILVTMMGAGCDYCIFILARYREERREGISHEKALRNSVVWAGESIATSGATVMIGFGSLSLFSVPMISTMGIVLAVGILVALIAALTLVTSLLSLWGHKMFWPSTEETFKKGSKAMKGWYGKISNLGSRYFHKSAKFSQDHAKAIAVAAVLITVPAVYVMATAETSYDFAGTLSTGESYEGLQEIEGYIGGGYMQPNYVVIEYDDPLATIELTTTESGSMPGLTWSTNGRNYDGLISLTSNIGEKENIASSTSIIKWSEAVNRAESDLGKLMEGLSTTEKDLLEGLFELYPTIKAHAVAGLALTMMPSESMMYAAGTLEGMGLDVGLLDAMNTMVTSNSFEGLGAYIAENESNMPDLDLVKMKSSSTVPVMDYSINYMGGILGGAAGSAELTFAKVTVITESSATSIRSMDSIAEINGMVDTFVAGETSVVSTWVTGIPAVTYDLSESVGDEFQYIGLIVIVLILLLLFFVMKSYTIPVRSLVTILMSVVWTIALTHILFTGILGIDVIWIVPMIVFVVCLGLGMDYDILLTTRIKENAMYHGMDNDAAIYGAVTQTGSVITICGLIMGGAFGTLMLSSMPMMQEFGFALSVAILIDALLVRTYIVPAVMHLLGKWNWIGPKWLQKRSQRIQEI